MAKVKTRFKSKPRHFLREWRKHRGLSQEAAAERIGVTHGAISQVERGGTAYTQGMLEALADAYNCQPADLIMRNPLDPAAPWSLWETLKPPQRKQAIRLLKALAEEDEEKAA